jgi:hypothetical protein
MSNINKSRTSQLDLTWNTPDSNLTPKINNVHSTKNDDNISTFQTFKNQASIASKNKNNILNSSDVANILDRNSNLELDYNNLQNQRQQWQKPTKKRAETNLHKDSNNILLFGQTPGACQTKRNERSLTDKIGHSPTKVRGKSEDIQIRKILTSPEIEQQRREMEQQMEQHMDTSQQEPNQEPNQKQNITIPETMDDAPIAHSPSKRTYQNNFYQKNVRSRGNPITYSNSEGDYGQKRRRAAGNSYQSQFASSSIMKSAMSGDI